MESRFNNKVQFKKWLADGLVKNGWEQKIYGEDGVFFSKRSDEISATISFNHFDVLSIALRWNKLTLTHGFPLSGLMTENNSVASMLEQMIYVMFHSFAAYVIKSIDTRQKR